VRHVLFALVLVGASFLGGAFVNGPGLKWLQAKVLGHAGLGDDVPTLSLPASVASDAEPDLSPKPSSSSTITQNAGSATKSSSSKGDVPTAQKSSNASLASKGNAGAPKPEPSPPPTVENKSSLGNMLGSLLSFGDSVSSAKTASTQGAKTEPVSKSGSTSSQSTFSAKSTKPIALASREVKSGSGGTDPASLPVLDPQTLPPGAGRPAPLDPSVTPAFLASLGSTPPGNASPTSGPAKIPVVQASASSEPRPLALPLPLSTEDGAGGGPAGNTDPASSRDEWGTIRQKLKMLGVTRYTIEGEPGGRVAFSCLIPLAGRQAVTQRFEAEGDDEIRAARATLRRIALWQATEHDRQGR